MSFDPTTFQLSILRSEDSCTAVKYAMVVHHKHISFGQVDSNGNSFTNQLPELDQYRVFPILWQNQEWGIVKAAMVFRICEKRVFTRVAVKYSVRSESDLGQMLSLLLT